MSVSCKRFAESGRFHFKTGDRFSINARLFSKTCLAAWLLLGIIFLPYISKGENSHRIFNDVKRTIVIDPGHGGPDAGARGAEGALEKNITLKLARMLAARLQERYRVILTRKDDYRVDLISRTATANHSNADIFLSLHTGGSFRRNVGGISAIYFKSINSPYLGLETESAKRLGKDKSAALWNEVQNRHAISSRRLAESVLSALEAQRTTFECNLDQAPLLVLEGADMPAILIEIGHLTNPSEKKALLDPDTASIMVNGIYNGIEGYFSQH